MRGDATEKVLITRLAELLNIDRVRYEELSRKLLSSGQLRISSGNYVLLFKLERDGVSRKLSQDAGVNFIDVGWKLLEGELEWKIKIVAQEIALQEALLSLEK